MRVLHHRQSLSHFKNHTNNRLENFFGKLKDIVSGKLKDIVSGNMTQAHGAKVLVRYDRRVAKQYKHETLKVVCYVHADYNEEMAAVLQIANHFTAHELTPQHQDKC